MNTTLEVRQIVFDSFQIGVEPIFPKSLPIRAAQGINTLRFI